MGLSEDTTFAQLRTLSQYERQHLVHHLLAAELDEDLQALLALETQQSRNAWYEFRHEHDEVDDFIRDIDRCKRSALDRGVEAIPLALRYALIRASIASQAGVVPKIETRD